MAKKPTDKKVVQMPSPAQASHVLLPVEVFNAMTQLVGSKIPWGDADQVMSLVKQNVKMHTPAVPPVPAEVKEDDAADAS
jgi:hypothetical protein